MYIKHKVRQMDRIDIDQGTGGRAARTDDILSTYRFLILFIASQATIYSDLRFLSFDLLEIDDDRG